MDTELSVLTCFKRHGADTSNGTMAAGTIVVNFNIFEYSLTHLFTSDKALALDGLDLQVVKKLSAQVLS